MSNLKLKPASKLPEYCANDDFYYNLTSGGYLKPEDFLNEEDARRVRIAAQLLEEFEELLIDYYGEQ